ncbi:MAG: GTP pyrophosphokinase family protein [Lachnospiraceae bacterium]|uniref:GTP pyrophosphokinase family protein n=1 Tax=Hominiventricola filiformis TaxID=2885352 RepID=A0AAE3AB60_9FIRM|nr:GTP pyrophosphokinase family protein [Hominiventricola filiformis]MCC2126758.1 GTP pyrophosphokinase family protein [Hominiventricola filiformis]MCI6881139.1 GTP pyrophosphokinase family protein [Clostridiaceae bacterium]MDY3824972.1 GTP pyrophosphokinase family protein [Lachnospiraceae bacterium]
MAEEMSIQQYIQKHSEKDAFATVMFVYQSALIQMRSRIDVLNNELSQVYSYNPIEYVKTRLKTPESIMQKLRKQGHSFNVNDLIEYIHDIAGIRITCSFFSEVYFLSDMIAKQDNLEVLSIKDYIKNPKESGYMSYHMLLSIPVALADAVVPAKVELQIRTMAMDFWASLEHKIYYKYEGNAPDYFERELQECASIISRLDTKMMSLNEAMKKIDGDGHI